MSHRDNAIPTALSDNARFVFDGVCWRYIRETANGEKYHDFVVSLRDGYFVPRDATRVELVDAMSTITQISPQEPRAKRTQFILHETGITRQYSEELLDGFDVVSEDETPIEAGLWKTLGVEDFWGDWREDDNYTSLLAHPDGRLAARSGWDGADLSLAMEVGDCLYVHQWVGVPELVMDHALMTSPKLLTFLKSLTFDEIAKLANTVGQIVDDPRFPSISDILRDVQP